MATPTAQKKPAQRSTAARPSAKTAARSTVRTGASRTRAAGSAATRRAGTAATRTRRTTAASASGRRPVQRKRRGNSPLDNLNRAYKRNPRLFQLAGIGVFAVLLIVILLIALLPSGHKADVPAANMNTVAPPAEPAQVTEAPVSAANQPATAVMSKEYKILDYPTTELPLGLQECARVDDSYFDDVLFIGDSVTLALRQYVLNTRKEQPNLLGQANFLAATSFGTRNALLEISETSIHPTIGGVKMTLEDAVATLGAKKVYIMLGMNDVGVSGMDKAVEYMMRLLALIKEKSPGIKIFVESATPRLSGTHPTTNKLFGYDVKLYDAIMELGDPDIYYVDVAHVMRDSEGKLFEEFCSDPEGMALHFNNAGCRQWIDFLYTHALA